jgi:hypothetical protein
VGEDGEQEGRPPAAQAQETEAPADRGPKGHGVAQSTDGGESWTLIRGGPDRIRRLALDPQNPNTLYAGGPGGLFASTFVPPVALDRVARRVTEA